VIWTLPSTVRDGLTSQGDVAGLSTEDLAVEVIQRELNELKIAREKAEGESA
jgi:hypothetical protein